MSGAFNDHKAQPNKLHFQLTAVVTWRLRNEPNAAGFTVALHLIWVEDRCPNRHLKRFRLGCSYDLHVVVVVVSNPERVSRRQWGFNFRVRERLLRIIICRTQHFLRICTHTHTTPINNDLCPSMLFKLRPCIQKL